MSLLSSCRQRNSSADVSNTFEDMFAIGHPPSHDDSDPEPLDIDVSSADLELFLDFMYKPVTQTLTVDQFEAVLSLCDKFDCRLLGKFVLGHLYTVVKTAPWKTFALAARYDDTELARRALSLMNHDEAHRNTSCANLSLRDAETIPLGYLLPVLHLRSSDFHRRDWQYVADMFRPLKRE